MAWGAGRQLLHTPVADPDELVTENHRHEDRELGSRAERLPRIGLRNKGHGAQTIPAETTEQKEESEPWRTRRRTKVAQAELRRTTATRTRTPGANKRPREPAGATAGQARSGPISTPAPPATSKLTRSAREHKRELRAKERKKWGLELKDCLQIHEEERAGKSAIELAAARGIDVRTIHRVLNEHETHDGESDEQSGHRESLLSAQSPDFLHGLATSRHRRCRRGRSPRIRS